MKEVLKFLKPYRRRMALAGLLILVSNLCELLLPTLMSEILNRGVAVGNLCAIYTYGLLMLVLALVSLAAVLVGIRQVSHILSGFNADLRASLFAKVNSMSFEEFGRFGTGSLVTRCTQDVEMVSWLATELSTSVVTIPVLFFGGVILAMFKDVMLAATLLAFIPAIFLVVFLVSRKIAPLWERADEYIDRQNDLMRQRLRGIRVIRAFNAEDGEHEKIADATRIMAENIIHSNVSQELITPVATFLLNFAAVLVVGLGGLRMEQGVSLSGGDVFAIVQYVALVSNAVVMGAFSLIMLPQARVAAGRIRQVLQSQAMGDPVEAQDLRFSGALEFDKVSFCYGGADEYALRNISMKVEPGEQVAVIGGTGSGKSTLVSMLLGFRMPTEGEVRMDGIPTVRLSRHTMRENISCVLQNTSIYSGTVRENLSMGTPDAPDDRLWGALQDAQAAEFVSAWADGLDHSIKQSGKNLSGGQKQRLSIARALLKQAPIYIFDDSFSALDFLTERNLRRALRSRLAGKSQIIITQRVATAMHADRIYVLDEGRMVGQGSHSGLLETCPVYKQIFASQTGGEV